MVEEPCFTLRGFGWVALIQTQKAGCFQAEMANGRRVMIDFRYSVAHALCNASSFVPQTNKNVNGWRALDNEGWWFPDLKRFCVAKAKP